MGNNCCGDRDKEIRETRAGWVERLAKSKLTYEDSLHKLTSLDRVRELQTVEEETRGDFEENNIVIVYDKVKLPKLMSSYFKVENVTRKALNKHFVPCVVSSNPKNRATECVVVLRNSDLLSTYSIKHAKQLGLSE